MSIHQIFSRRACSRGHKSHRFHDWVLHSCRFSQRGSVICCGIRMASVVYGFVSLGEISRGIWSIFGINDLTEQGCLVVDQSKTDISPYDAISVVIDQCFLLPSYILYMAITLEAIDMLMTPFAATYSRRFHTIPRTTSSSSPAISSRSHLTRLL